ncbi:riboflavin biosynthesis protein RibF [Asaia sp. W19]|uniref:bifunctional riboflavin kinase/FAD synthetase n=1 Tax=unclassified Asaia TaxID=2685023 RepID=UPI000F8C979A|nr:bifunctional riboflavin kinase/FAD synthetase [Asaia sp. W19]RUT27459.1 riboflavin biosynthesis protein RibF [Asaia sp. W19]
MTLYEDWTAIPPEARGAAVALGNFDGVHLGHRHLLRSLHTARPELPLGAVTFEPHPREFFRPQDPPLRLMLPEIRARILQEQGAQRVFQLRFDADFSHLSPDAFVESVLDRALGVKHVACGPDFAFGHRRAGSIAYLGHKLETLGIGLTIVPPLTDIGGPFSSSRIRRLLQEGYPERAAEELGRPWFIAGGVAHGDKRGRLLGFPTANIPLGRHIEPARGVYAVTIRHPDGRVTRGVANIGRRPTINDGQESRLEVHIFDVSEDLYGQTLEVSLHKLLREERRFEGLDALKAQIAEDAASARIVLSTLS